MVTNSNENNDINNNNYDDCDTCYNNVNDNNNYDDVQLLINE